MSLQSELTRIKNRIEELWKHKIFRYAIMLHLFYFTLSLVLTLTFLRDQNDFLVFQKVGEVFVNNINDLYNQDNYLWDFRYFPLSAIFFVPFYLLGFDLGFILLQCITLILNVLICIILYKTIMLVRNQDHEKDDKRVILFICFYLMGVPHVFNYILGQINIPFIFLVLLSLYVFLKHDVLKWQFLGSVILGISIIIKPIALFLVPFLIILHFNLKNKKFNIEVSKSIVRLIGVILPASLNLILFILYPQMFEGFVSTNFTGNNPIQINFSFSITKLILNFCYVYDIPFNQLSVLFIVCGVVAGSGFLIYIMRGNDKYKIIYGYTLGILIQLLVFYDSWDHHLLNLTPLLIIIIFNFPRNSKITTPYIKKGFFYFNFFDIIFMILWFLTAPYFPYNFVATFFLIIAFIGTCKGYFLKSLHGN